MGFCYTFYSKKGYFNACGNGGTAGGTASLGMTISIGTMSLSSRYETCSRSGVSSFADEEEEEEEGEEGMVMKNDLNRKTKEGSGVVNAVDGEEEEEEEEEKGLKMDVDVG